ncbi:FecR family protein [Carboxylicivirga sp. A043]|uniref:FecR family protein n=1 Tax=Carboxylicivirga litoralis TaxID=2816963 RepID=UPI0021CB507C|nr:FecR family protein [Carboxylicivirga sp. A043]MCU4154395.1 FecR family protein [Carboxylicivirga sp. A043]
MTKVDKNKLKRYVSGNYSAQDERYIIERFNDKGSVSELKKHLKEDWKKEESEASKKDLSHVLEAIHTKIEPKPQSKLIRFYKVYARIAAILLLPLVILFVVKNISNNSTSKELSTTSIHAMNGSKVEFTLPDGTSGWLKGGSQLTYLTAFENRNVQLRGEAFFDVTHDEQRPFQVFGSESRIVVLGTRFNANMWPENNTTEVVLESGKVKFVSKNNEATILQPGERLVYQKQLAKTYVQEVKTDEHTGWVDGVLTMRGDNLRQVAIKLSDWYHVEVLVDGAYPEDYKFRATFKDESIEEVLRLMKLTAPITYKIQKQTKLSDGTYSKKKITLKMNNQ